jgi:hypothetical protein
MPAPTAGGYPEPRTHVYVTLQEGDLVFRNLCPAPDGKAPRLEAFAFVSTGGGRGAGDDTIGAGALAAREPFLQRMSALGVPRHRIP